MITYPWALEIGLETSKISDESVQQVIVVGPSEASVDQNTGIDGRGQRIVGERVGYISQGLESVVPSDSVRTWVHPDNVAEASGRDLKIVVWITPATQSAHLVVVEHCRVLCIVGILHAIHQNTEQLEKDR